MPATNLRDAARYIAGHPQLFQDEKLLGSMLSDLFPGNRAMQKLISDLALQHHIQDEILRRGRLDDSARRRWMMKVSQDSFAPADRILEPMMACIDLNKYCLLNP